MALAFVVGCSDAGTPPARNTAGPGGEASRSVAPSRSLLLLPEAEAWAHTQRSMPLGVPVARPTWLPAAVDRSRVELRELDSATGAPRYAVVYRVDGMADLTFALTRLPLPKVEAGFGTRVRRVEATLNLPQSVFLDPATPALRRVQWRESDHGLIIASEKINGADLLGIAWALDLTTAPPPLYPYSRTRAGACARAQPELTIMRMIELMGGGDRDAMLDCFSLDLIGYVGLGLGGGASLPTATLVAIVPRPRVADRLQFLVSWRFSRDPGGPDSLDASRFYLLVVEDGLYRVFDHGTAPLGPPP